MIFNHFSMNLKLMHRGIPPIELRQFHQIFLDNLRVTKKPFFVDNFNIF